MGRFSKNFLSFLTQNRTRVDEAPRRYVNFAPMQSSMLNLMKISRSCSKIIRRTLRPGKNWLRYSSFSVISPVKWSNLRAWPNFEHFKISNPHWQNVTMCQKIPKKSLSKWIAKDCAGQSRLRICKSYLKICSVNVSKMDNVCRHFLQGIVVSSVRIYFLLWRRVFMLIFFFFGFGFWFLVFGFFGLRVETFLDLV